MKRKSPQWEEWVLRTLYSAFVYSLLDTARVWRRARMLLLKPLFAAYGKNFRFDPSGDYTFATISVGDDVHLGMRPTLLATRSRIMIGNKVIFGPEVTIRGGNHEIERVGRFIADIRDDEKQLASDRDVVIEDDVWVGTRAIILHGVTISRGAVVAAGAVVTKNVPYYSVVGGVPAKVLRFRWDVETILRHEALLYAPEQRLTRAELARWRSDLSVSHDATPVI